MPQDEQFQVQIHSFQQHLWKPTQQIQSQGKHLSHKQGHKLGQVHQRILKRQSIMPLFKIVILIQNMYRQQQYLQQRQLNNQLDSKNQMRQQQRHHRRYRYHHQQQSKQGQQHTFHLENQKKMHHTQQIKLLVQQIQLFKPLILSLIMFIIKQNQQMLFILFLMHLFMQLTKQQKHQFGQLIH